MTSKSIAPSRTATQRQDLSHCLFGHGHDRPLWVARGCGRDDRGINNEQIVSTKDLGINIDNGFRPVCSNTIGANPVVGSQSTLRGPRQGVAQWGFAEY